MRAADHGVLTNLENVAGTAAQQRGEVADLAVRASAWSRKGALM